MSSASRYFNVNADIFAYAVCGNLGDLAVLELATLPSLRRLSLVQLRKLTDNAVYFLSEHSKQLERLHLSHCDALSLDSIFHVISKLPGLVHLSATGIPALTRLGVERFSERPPQVSDRDSPRVSKQQMLNSMQNSPPSNQELFRVFTGKNIKLLHGFLAKEMDRARESEARNLIFVPRGDDAKDLY